MRGNPMDKKSALEIVAQACASIQANLATHQQIQDALKVLEALVNPVDTKSK